MFASARPRRLTLPVHLARIGRISAITGTLGAALLVAGCAEDEAVVFPGDPEDPTNLVVIAASGSGVELRWQHDDDDEAGFRVERVVGGVGEVLAELPENTLQYIDTDPDTLRTMLYRVRALYGNTATGPTEAPLINLSILPPDSSTAFGTALNPDSIRISWLPPDLETFNGFSIKRLLHREGEVTLERFTMIDHETSLPAEFMDDDLPLGTTGERLEYQVATRQASTTSPVFSGPAPAERFQWSFPTLASTFSTDPRDHDRAEAYYLPGVALAVISNSASDGSAEVLVIDPVIREAQAFVLFRGNRPTGALAATVHQMGYVMLAERADGAGTTTFSRHTLSDPPSDLNQFDVTDAVVGVWAAPSGNIAILDNATCRTIDPTDGTTVSEIVFANPLASMTFPGPTMVAVVETRGSDDTAQSRIAHRSYPQGTEIWTSGWLSGQAVSAMSGVMASSTGDHLILNLRVFGGGEETHLFTTTSPLPLDAKPGRSVTFLENDSHVVILNPYPAVPEAFEVVESGLRSEGTFGARTTTTAFTAPGNRVWTWQQEPLSALRVYDMVKQWSRIPSPGARMSELEDVQRFYLVTP